MTEFTTSTADPAAPSYGVAVRIRLWGLERPYLGYARLLATHEAAAAGWQVVEVEEMTGAPCPIRRRDPDSIAWGARYRAAWAAYPAAQPSPA